MATSAARAETGPRSLFDTSPAQSLFQSSAPLIDAPSDSSKSRGASLFAGTRGTSLFAPRAPGLRGGDFGETAAHLRDLIASAEAGPAGYDAIHHGAQTLPARVPTQLTLAEIDAWTRATPGQPHAIGRYQFIPMTLRELIVRAGLPQSTRFSPRVQDQLADLLLSDAGFAEAKAGTLSRTAFMNNLAKIWAGLPTSSGKSYYHGFAGNRATMTWARFEREMAPIFPG